MSKDLYKLRKGKEIGWGTVKMGWKVGSELNEHLSHFLPRTMILGQKNKNNRKEFAEIDGTTACFKKGEKGTQQIICRSDFSIAQWI